MLITFSGKCFFLPLFLLFLFYKLITMKKIIFALAIGLTLASCTNDAISKSHEGVDFEVEFLFEKDGIKLYRFYDNGRYHYYTDRGETSSIQKQGKNNYYQENIQ